MFSSAAGLRAAVRRLREQPLVREGQASKNRLHQSLPQNFHTQGGLVGVFLVVLIHFFKLGALFPAMLGTFKDTKRSTTEPRKKAEQHISIPPNLQLLPASLCEEFLSFCGVTEAQNAITHSFFPSVKAKFNTRVRRVTGSLRS